VPEVLLARKVHLGFVATGIRRSWVAPSLAKQRIDQGKPANYWDTEHLGRWSAFARPPEAPHMGFVTTVTAVTKICDTPFAHCTPNRTCVYPHHKSRPSLKKR
jgi:hypothetical protein